MLNQRIGITVGKFMPFHLGHKLMIDIAAKILDGVVVIVDTENDAYPLYQRYDDISRHYATDGSVTVMKHPGVPLGPTVDKYGTCLDDSFWDQWIKIFRASAPYATHFVSSDRYGAEAARRLGLKWFPVDPMREVFNISGTMIRSNTRKYFDYIVPSVKHHYGQVIAVVGPESTGKSILTEKLAKYYGTKYVPEWGRTISEARNNVLNAENFDDIINVQKFMISEAMKSSTCGFVFTDTEDLTTRLYAPEYLDRDWTSTKTIMADYYLLLKPNVEWVNDGYRIMPDQQKRNEFFEKMKNSLELYDVKYDIIDEITYNKRTNQALRFVSNFLGQ